VGKETLCGKKMPKHALLGKVPFFMLIGNQPSERPLSTISTKNSGLSEDVCRGKVKKKEGLYQEEASSDKKEGDDPGKNLHQGKGGGIE